MTQHVRVLTSQNRDAGVLRDPYRFNANGNVAAVVDQQKSINSRGTAPPPCLTRPLLLLQEGVGVDAGLLENGAQRALGHVAGMVGDRGVSGGASG
jgi:hypothetical protein